VNGSIPLTGTFTLLATQLNGTSSLSATTEAIPVDASSSEIEYFLNALPALGSVTVSSALTANGYKWQVTFNGCKVVNGIDVCNKGDIELLQANASGLSLGNISVVEVVQGSGPGRCGNAECATYVTNLTPNPPYNATLLSLVTGNPYYAQVLARNIIGYGLPTPTTPRFLVPTYNPPGIPPPVQLVSSTGSSITVSWSSPRFNGGAAIIGYELWIDEWAGGYPRQAFDGTDQPSVMTFTVSVFSSFGVESGRSYRFFV